MEYQIGEFSRITRLTVKTIRFYHGEGLLPPLRIDSFTGYRYYGKESVERARLIALLRGFDFSIEEIRRTLAECSEDEDIAALLERKAETLRQTSRKMLETERRIREMLLRIEGQKTMDIVQEAIIKDYPAELAATIRYMGRYPDIGPYFGQLFKAAGGKTYGKPFALYHDLEYKEADADIEAGIPVRAWLAAPGIECKTLAACRCVMVFHRGSYDSLASAYQKLFDKAKQSGLKPGGPIREIYLKGPGMIFRGNPRNYLTEIQLPIEADSVPAQ